MSQVGLGGRQGEGGFGGGRPPDPTGVFAQQRTKQPGVFVSHASEDAPIAQAFSELIHDASAGMIPAYSSSSRDPAAGIPYGDDWFAWIQAKIKESGNVVALITPVSVGRPWILFEAGYGKALDGIRVFGLRLGTTGDQAYVGPFKAFQNSGSDPDELVKLCRQLFEGTQCDPRNELLNHLIEEFRLKTQKHLKDAKEDVRKPNPESEAVFKALEEIKALAQASRPSAPERDDLDMQELDYFAHVVMEMSPRDIDPGLRASMIAAVLGEAGMPWIPHVVDYCLRKRLDPKALHRMLREPVHLRRRRAPFPLEMVIHELLNAVAEHRRRTREKATHDKPDDENAGEGEEQ